MAQFTQIQLSRLDEEFTTLIAIKLYQLNFLENLILLLLSFLKNHVPVKLNLVLVLIWHGITSPVVMNLTVFNAKIPIGTFSNFSAC